MDFRNPKEIWKDPREAVVDFGRIFGIGVFVIGGVLQWHKSDWSLSFSTFSNDPNSLIIWWMVAGIVLTLSTLTSWLMRPVYFTWMLVGQCMGWVVQKIILGVIFYLLFTPVGLLYRRWCNVITKGPDQKLDSYWEPKKIASNKQSYYRQF